MSETHSKLQQSPALIAGKIISEAGYPIDVGKVFDFADWCDEPVPGIHTATISVNWEFPSGIIRIKQPHPLNRYRWPGKGENDGICHRVEK